MLMDQCGNIEFGFDVLPPWTRFVNVSFDLVENGFSRQYEISGYVRGWAGNLLNETGTVLVGDDD